MDWSAPIDAYCERLGPEFWAEPLNAATNAAFILAALVALVYAVRRRALDGAVALLILLLAAIGVGSFLFHTVATRGAVLADVVPIQLFIVVYFFLVMRRFAGLGGWFALSVTANFLLFAALAGPALGRAVGDRLNGSEGYLPPLVALLVVGAALYAAGRRPAGRALVAGALLFAVSLAFRTADAAACGSLPVGTHFVWHVLNGALLGGLTLAMIRYGWVVRPERVSGRGRRGRSRGSRRP